MAGRNIEAFLPAGDDAARWRRHLNEAQMLLHAHPSQRRARGERRAAGQQRLVLGRGARAPSSALPYDAVWSDHPLAAGLAAASGVATRPLPASAAPFLKDTGRENPADRRSRCRRRRYGDVAGLARGAWLRSSALVRAAARRARRRRAANAHAARARPGHGYTAPDARDRCASGAAAPAATYAPGKSMEPLK